MSIYMYYYVLHVTNLVAMANAGTLPVLKKAQLSGHFAPCCSACSYTKIMLIYMCSVILELL